MFKVRGVVASVSVVACVVGLAGCQEAVRIAVENGCEQAIEVDSNEIVDPVSSGGRLRWKVIEPGLVVVSRKFSVDVDRVFVWARIAESEVVPEPLVVDRGDLREDGDTLVVVITGDLCP